MSILIYFFYLHTTIRQKYMMLFHFILSFCTTIRPKIKVLIDLCILVAHNHSTKIYDRFSFILSLCTTIRPKIRVFYNLFFLFMHDHSTKVRGHSYSLIYSFLNCATILFAIFMAVLLLHFVCSISGSTTFIFRLLYS